MRIYIAIVLTLNLFAVAIYLPSTNRTHIEPSLARIAVRDQLAKIPEFTSNEPLKLTSGCADAGNDDGLISGRGQTFTRFQHIGEIPVNRNTHFSYQAKVSAVCWSYNLNCYGVDALALDGTTFVAPRL